MTLYDVQRLGHLGDGIAPGPVYAPGALPGDVVTGTNVDGRLQDIRIVTPSDDRVAPACPHFSRCGGCQLQHASDPFLKAWKTDVVKSALRAKGLGAEFLETHVSPEMSRRRAKLTARRTKKGATSGFIGKGSDTVVEIPECRLLRPELVAALPMAEQLALLTASRKQPISVTVTSSTEGLDVNVEGGKSLDQKVREALVGLAENFDLARLCLESEVIMQRRPAWQDFASIPVEPPPGAFLQATKEGEQVLRADVQATVGSASKIIDLFAGCGTFALPLAASGPVHAVECDPHMVAAMDKAWRHRPGLKKLTLETRDLFRNPLTRDELRCADAVVIDPPRAGALAQVAELAVSGVPRIAYVSCDPATFAREAHTLVQNGYALDAVRVVDQFRWSSHVEIVAGFSHSSTR